MSSLAAGHKTLVPELVDALAGEGRGDIVVVVGGVVPPEDQEPLLAAGVEAIFGPGSKVTDVALELLGTLEERSRAEGE